MLSSSDIWQIFLGILTTIVVLWAAKIWDLKNPPLVQLDISRPGEQRLIYPSSHLAVSRYYLVSYHRWFPVFQLLIHGIKIEIPGGEYEIEQLQYVDPSESINPTEVPLPRTDVPRPKNGVTIVKVPRDTIKQVFLKRNMLFGFFPRYTLPSQPIRLLHIDFHKQLREEERTRGITVNPYVLDPHNHQLVWRLENKMGGGTTVYNYELVDEIPPDVTKFVDIHTTPLSNSSLKDLVVFNEVSGDLFRRDEFPAGNLRVKWLVSRVPPSVLELVLVVDVKNANVGPGQG